MILITGSEGFIGGHLKKALGGAPYMTVDKKTGGDILFEEDLYSLKPDLIIHLAAVASIPYSMKHPKETYEVNVLGTKNILSLNPKKIVFASSGSAANQDSPYAASKKAAEDAIKEWGGDYCILRLGNVYGEGDDKSAIKHFLEDDPIKVTGDGSQRRSFVYAGDVARAFIEAISKQGTYNIGHEEYSIKEVAEMFDKEIIYTDTPEGETHTYDIEWDGMPGWSATVKLKDWVKEQQ